MLTEINEHTEGLELARNVAEPKLFFYSHSGLKDRLAKERSKGTPNEALISDIATAIQYVEEDHADNIVDFVRLTANQEITYDLLWALFAPNTVLYHYHNMTEQAQILIARTTYYSQRENQTRYAYIDCYVISNDGDSFGLARQGFEIDQYSGASKIQHLTVYPLIYNPDQDAMRDHAIRRGKRFATMDQRAYKEISGPAMRESIRESTTQDKVIRNRFKFHVRGRKS